MTNEHDYVMAYGYASLYWSMRKAYDWLLGNDFSLLYLCVKHRVSFGRIPHPAPCAKGRVKFIGYR